MTRNGVNRVGVVFDANVMYDHMYGFDESCSEAYATAARSKHKLVVCEKLLREYRGILARESQQMYAHVQMWLQRTLPWHLVETHPDPDVRIDFGPPEDRFHMQLAVDARALFHVTKDRGVLRTAAQMKSHGVTGCRPERYVRSGSEQVPR